MLRHNGERRKKKAMGTHGYRDLLDAEASKLGRQTDRTATGEDNTTRT